MLGTSVSYDHSQIEWGTCCSPESAPDETGRCEADKDCNASSGFWGSMDLLLVKIGGLASVWVSSDFVHFLEIGIRR